MFFPNDFYQRVADKECCFDDGSNYLKNPDPILLQGSLVMTGQGKALVCCVGTRTLRE
jgi:magnesium-transporting ATPase (P-type)